MSNGRNDTKQTNKRATAGIYYGESNSVYGEIIGSAKDQVDND